jgi:heme/copper-type cytochrome/quinol oxidase subunit 3
MHPPTLQIHPSRKHPPIGNSCYYLFNFLIEETMKFLLFIANAFINTMGITQPSPQAANRAAWFIVIMLTAVLAAVATIAFVAIHWASNH